MKTPAGIECEYFYGDYYRGRKKEECRLIGTEWVPALCSSCPVPAIKRANGCANLRLRPMITRSLVSGFRRQVRVTAYCEKNQRTGFDPYLGCGECHILPFYLQGGEKS